MFFISFCADRTIANVTLGASLNCQQRFRGLLCRSTLRQGGDEAHYHELHSTNTDCAHVSDAHFLTFFGTDVRETRNRSPWAESGHFWSIRPAQFSYICKQGSSWTQVQCPPWVFKGPDRNTALCTWTGLRDPPFHSRGALRPPAPHRGFRR